MEFSTHEFYAGQESVAVDFYTRASEESVTNLASEGASTPELTQALCLTALRHLKSKSAYFFSFSF
jgi:uridine phosphorylase